MEKTRRIRVKRRSEPVILELEDGTEENCKIMEMTGDESESYLESNKENYDFEITEKGEFKIKELKSFKGMYSNLLIYTLYHEKGQAFTLEEIKKLPSTAQKSLFEMSQEVNGLTEKSKDKLKND